MLNEQRQNQSKWEVRRRERPELSEDKIQQRLRGEQRWAQSCPLTWGTPWSHHSPRVEWPAPGHAFHSKSDPPRRNGPSVSGWCHSRCTHNTQGGGDVPVASRTRRCRRGKRRGAPLVTSTWRWQAGAPPKGPIQGQIRASPLASSLKGVSPAWRPETFPLKTSGSPSHFNRAALLFLALRVHTLRVSQPRKAFTNWLWDTGPTSPLCSIFQARFFFSITPTMGSMKHFPHFHGLHNLQGHRCLGKADTHTMPVPHLSHMGSFWAFPIDAATLVTGALTLLNPEGLLGSPKRRETLGLARKGRTV